MKPKVEPKPEPVVEIQIDLPKPVVLKKIPIPQTPPVQIVNITYNSALQKFIAENKSVFMMVLLPYINSHTKLDEDRYNEIFPGDEKKDQSDCWTQPSLSKRSLKTYNSTSSNDSSTNLFSASFALLLVHYCQHSNIL